MVPGFIDLNVSQSARLILRAGGALAVFAIVYFFNPAKMTSVGRNAHHDPPATDPPPVSNAGSLTPAMEEAFRQVWLSLTAVQRAGEELWRHVSDETLTSFGQTLSVAVACVNNNAIFFSIHDHDALQQALRAANFYLDGKTRLSDLQSTTVASVREQARESLNVEIQKQLSQNRRWLTRYENLLLSIRTQLHEAMSPERAR